jgi:uncharacterized low-complexity protein
MSSIKSKNSLGVVLGAAVLTATIAPAASADVNPFQARELAQGYGLVNYDKHEGEEGKCGEGACGEKKPEGKCGEGKCGG